MVCQNVGQEQWYQGVAVERVTEPGRDIVVGDGINDPQLTHGRLPATEMLVGHGSGAHAEEFIQSQAHVAPGVEVTKTAGCDISSITARALRRTSLTSASVALP